VNAHQSVHFMADIAAVAAISSVAGLMLPKIESVDDLRQIDAALTRSETDHDRRAGSLRLLLIIESAKATWLAYELAAASSRVESLCFGGARDGDLMVDLGVDWSNDGAAMLHARQRVLLAARAAGCSVPLDGVFADLRDGEGFQRDTRLSRSLGYRGRTVVHPSQIEPTNRIYAPTPDEIAASRKLLESYERATANGRASTVFEGRMIDTAMAKAARAMLAAAETAAQDQNSS
jgi:citrate lyase subunit beta/citryl-CoA lyase